MAFFAGFDIRDYPGLAMMNWLKAHSNLKWTGYYLEPAPNRSPSGWPDRYHELKGNWGIAPIYVGQQDPRTAKQGYAPCSVLTSDQGRIDGRDAAGLAARDGFPPATFIYLDWEYGGLDGHGNADYISAWMRAIAADGRFQPALYCSHVISNGIADLLDSIDPVPVTRFWYWKVPTGDTHPFTGDLSSIPELNPAGCGVVGADVWQREQNAIVKFAAGAPARSLPLDFSTAASADPGAPLNIA